LRRTNHVIPAVGKEGFALSALVEVVGFVESLHPKEAFQERFNGSLCGISQFFPVIDFDLAGGVINQVVFLYS
jgi:hypothetical protein